MAEHETLGIDAETVEAVRERFQHARQGGRTYRRLTDYRRDLERGTDLIADTGPGGARRSHGR